MSVKDKKEFGYYILNVNIQKSYKVNIKETSNVIQMRPNEFEKILLEKFKNKPKFFDDIERTDENISVEINSYDFSHSTTEKIYDVYLKECKQETLQFYQALAYLTNNPMMFKAKRLDWKDNECIRCDDKCVIVNQDNKLFDLMSNQIFANDWITFV